jgi:hypothetical protein
MTKSAAKRATEPYRVVSGKNDEGNPVFCVLLKRTYDIISGKQPARAEHARPLELVDVYNPPGDPETCSVRFERDILPFKTATDVVVIGKVHAPRGESTAQCDAEVQVGRALKQVRVIGDRECIYRPGESPAFTEPLPFTEMSLLYERAYGGTDRKSIPDMPFPYARNPVGAGFVLNNTGDTVDGLALPNFEDPSDLLTPERVIVGELEDWPYQPLPQGFSWYQMTWYPRCSFVGAVPGFVDPDTVMPEETLGLVPKGQIALARQFKLPSFDVRFNNGASPGLMLPFLSGGESVRLKNLCIDGDLQFLLPVDIPVIAMDIGFGLRELQPALHTVCIRPEDRQLDLVWRGAHEYPGIDWLPEMQKLVVEIG